jgi:hypothetical protein
MALNTEPKYPNRRAYVLQLRSDARPDTLVGRIENLITGRHVEFGSAHELLESLVDDLEAAAADVRRPPQAADGT